MQTRYWNLKNDTDGVMLREAAALIKQGEAVAFPTETVYGLGADGLNGEAMPATVRLSKKFLKPKAARMTIHLFCTLQIKKIF